jgi:hypothetical protein
LGMTTENVAHRFAVEWDDEVGTRVGVFIPRRDTDSRITALAGDRIFPGVHHAARFRVEEHGSELRIGVDSRDGALQLSVAAQQTTSLPGKLFGSLDDAVSFFRGGSLGFSPGAKGRLIGVRLESRRWDAHPVRIERMASSLFDDARAFPEGSCTLDFGLVMRDLPARWRSEGVLQVHSPARAT